jgi:putative thioredoxin
MNELTNIVDVSLETFQDAVVERSRSVPVLVDFWADWCGPCQMQLPVLHKLVEEYAGKFVLAKVDTDRQKQLAAQHRIRSLPTMHLYKNGARVEEILGAQTETTLRNLLDRYIERASDRIRASARQLFAQGERAQALQLLEQARAGEPDNHQLTLDYAELQLRAGHAKQAGDLLDTLPHEVRNDSAALRLRALIDFSSAAAQVTDLAQAEQQLAATPENSALRYRLAAACMLAGRVQEALEHFLYILQHDRGFNDDAARKALLAAFEMLGSEHELTGMYRRRMFTALH